MSVSFVQGMLAIDACNRLDVYKALRHKVFIPEVAMDESYHPTQGHHRSVRIYNYAIRFSG